MKLYIDVQNKLITTAGQYTYQDVRWEGDNSPKVFYLKNAKIEKTGYWGNSVKITGDVLNVHWIPFDTNLSRVEMEHFQKKLITNENDFLIKPEHKVLRIFTIKETIVMQSRWYYLKDTTPIKVECTNFAIFVKAGEDQEVKE